MQHTPSGGACKDNYSAGLSKVTGGQPKRNRSPTSSGTVKAGSPVNSAIWTLLAAPHYEQPPMSLSSTLLRSGHQKHCFFCALGHGGIGGFDIDALLRQLPGYLGQCSRFVFEFELFERPFRVRHPRLVQSLLGFADLFHDDLRRALRPGTTAQKGHDIYFCIGEYLRQLSYGS